MAIVLSATWIARTGEEQTVLEALRQLAPPSREESGNLLYQAYQDPAEPSVFRIFEIYTDQEAITAHTESEHFQTWAVGQAIPALADRQRAFYQTLDV